MKRLILLPLIAVTLALAACGSSGSNSSASSKGPTPAGGSNNGHTTITVWQGDTEVEAAAFKTLVAEFNKTHPNITVNSQFYGNSDYALQKVLAAIAGGKPPDISYLYGSWAPNIATNPQLVPLNKFIDSDPSFNWNDFFPAERKVATVGNSIIGVPALVDNLALVYNKTLFKQAGHPAAHGHLDVERLRERRHQADQPGQEAVRLGLRQRRQRGHGLALLGDAVAGGRLDPLPRRQAGGL